MDIITLAKINKITNYPKLGLQQGLVYLYNKFVISAGCVISKMTGSRYLQVSLTGTYVSGNVSKISADGKYAAISDEQNILLVPTNATGSAVYYYVYVDWDSGSGKYKCFIASAVPDGKLVLYKVTVPANDTGADLTNVTLTDQRRIEALNAMRNTEPYVLVSIPIQPADTNYDVNVTVEAASDRMAVGDIVVYDKQVNGFKIKVTGYADNIQLRWTFLDQI